MFEGDFTISGKHATYVKYLKDSKVFNRYIDVYMAGAVLGALYEKRAGQTPSSDRARIYADAFDTERNRCHEIFKVVILSDTSKPWSAEERANICFRYRDRMDEMAMPSVTQEEIKIMKEAKKLFDEYALGGIELLYDCFSGNTAMDEDGIVDCAYKTLFDQYNLIENLQEDDDAKLLRPEY